MLLTPSVHVTENWKCSFWSLYYKTKKEQENVWVLVTTLSLVLKGLKKKDLDCITRGNIRIRGLDVSAKIIVYDHKRRQHAECSFCLRVLSQTGHQYLETPKQRHSHHIMYPDLLNPRSLMRSNVTSTCIRWKTVTELSATFRKRFLEWNVLKTLVYSSRVDGRKLNFLKMMTSPCLTLTMFHCYFPPEHFFFFSG